MSVTNNTRRFRATLSIGLVAGVLALGAVSQANVMSSAPAVKGSVSPLSLSRATFREFFVENKGQWDSRANLLLRTGGIDTWVADDGVYFDYYRIRDVTPPRPMAERSAVIRKLLRSGHVVKMQFEGATTTDVSGSKSTGSTANYLRNGATRAMSASVFEEAQMSQVYPGISTRLYVESGQPRFDFIVQPGANPNQIRVRYQGARNLRVANGAIQFDTSMGVRGMGQLFAYQVVNGQRRQVPCQFTIDESGTVRYAVGNYDPTRTLVIDPIVYSTLLGGTGASDFVNEVTVDGLTSAYAVGDTDFATFPTSIGAYDEEQADLEGFVTKFLPDGSDVAYSTFIGGSTVDTCGAVAVDAQGFAYVAGTTDSTDFDTTPGSFAQAPPVGDFDMFVVKLNQTGTALVYSTLLGSSGFDQAFGIALEQDGTAYVAGTTTSGDFPFVNAAQTFQGPDGDGTLTRLSADGSALVYSTSVGGNDTLGPFSPERSVDVAVDIDRNAYVLVRTNAVDAATSPGCFDPSANGLDCYVAKFQPDGTREWATFLGGNASENATGIALDRTANVFITGGTNSFNFPRTAAAFDRTYNLGSDCFVTKMNRLGTGLIYSTFLGTAGGAIPLDIAVDDIGFAHLSGYVAQNTLTAQFIPVTPNADDSSYNGPTAFGGDAYLQVINDSGTGQLYCGYLGGSADDAGLAIGIDGARNAYVVGYTASSTPSTIAFPTTPGAFKEGFPNDVPPNFTTAFPEGFVTKIKTRIPLTIVSISINPNSVASGESTTGTVTISAAASNGGATVSLSNNNNSVVSIPATVTIPEGQTSTTFNIDTTPNMTTTQTVLITATIEGDSKSAMLTISPWLTALTLSNDTVVGGNLVGGRITIFRPAPAGGISVNMNSTVPTVATVPAIVTVPTGLTTTTFDVTTRGVIASQFVDITASYAGLTRTVTLEVIPARLVSISFVPTVVSGGTPVTGKVQLNGNAPDSGAIITLTSSSPSALSVPPTVTIAAQTKEVSFPGTTDVVTVDTSVTVSATYGVDTVTAVVDVLRANLISLAVTPDVIQGGNTALGTVGLDAPAATGGVTIPLTSSVPSVAAVPATVVVPSGSTNANFNVVTQVVGADVPVTISATRGSVTLNVNILVKRIEFSIVLAPSSVVGGQNSIGTLTLVQPAPPGGVTIPLSSSNPAVAQVQASITIPESGTSGTFTVSTVPVQVDTNVDITAGLGTATASATLTVNAPGPIIVTLNPNQVSGGSSSNGSVGLNGNAPSGGVVVSLSSSDPAATVPATVTIPAGSASASFTVNTIAVTTTTVATITATANGESASEDLTIVAANLLSIRFNPSRVRGGQQTSMIITLDAAAPPGGAVIDITNSNPNVATIPAQVTIPAGSTVRTVTITTRRVSRTLATQVTATYNGQLRQTILTATR